MKEIKLTKGYIALVDDSDYEWLNQWKWHANKSGNKYYAVHNFMQNGKYRCIKMHRLILGLEDPLVYGDHIDMDTLNNQRSNLRECNHAQNMSNSNGSKNRKFTYKGVRFHKGGWNAKIRHNKKDFHIGVYKTERDAALAYNEAAIKYHGEFARLNAI